MDTYYGPKFWDGYRRADIEKGIEGHTQKCAELRTACALYQRRFNDGDTPHPATFERLCKAANMARPVDLRNDPATLDDLVEALLDLALEEL